MFKNKIYKMDWKSVTRVKNFLEEIAEFDVRINDLSWFNQSTTRK